eukprot:2640086-Rhodomonas_salina.2
MSLAPDNFVAQPSVLVAAYPTSVSDVVQQMRRMVPSRCSRPIAARSALGSLSSPGSAIPDVSSELRGADL